MKLALIGKSIQHSKSPSLYKEIIGSQVQYDLLDYSQSKDIPSLEELAKIYQGINITAPYKTHFLNDVTIQDEKVKALGSINTISFSDTFYATNTDVIAAEKILRRYQNQFPNLDVILLGSGSMASMLKILFQELKISYSVKSRKNNDDMSALDLRAEWKKERNTLIINSCSRDFVFQGTLHPEFLFWDLNYDFKPHQNTLPSRVLSYVDGQEMLRLQAEAAANFWISTPPKLKC